MTLEALNTLFKSIEFEKYDEDFYQYQCVFSGLAKQYDYNKLVKKLREFIRTNRVYSSSNKFNYFKTYMSNNNQPKLTDQEYIELDNKEEKEWFDYEEKLKELKARMGKLEGLVNKPERKKFDVNNWVGTPHEPYIKYTFNYLRQISLERKTSITRLCEIKGLVYEWLRWED